MHGIKMKHLKFQSMNYQLEKLGIVNIFNYQNLTKTNYLTCQ